LGTLIIITVNNTWPVEQKNWNY